LSKTPTILSKKKKTEIRNNLKMMAYKNP